MARLRDSWRFSLSAFANPGNPFRLLHPETVSHLRAMFSLAVTPVPPVTPGIGKLAFENEKGRRADPLGAEAASAHAIRGQAYRKLSAMSIVLSTPARARRVETH